MGEDAGDRVWQRRWLDPDPTELGGDEPITKRDAMVQVTIRRRRVRDVETQVVPPEYTQTLVENDMLKVWQSMEPLNASEVLIELRGRAGDCGYDLAKDARHLMWQLKAEEEKALEAASEPNTTDTLESRLRDKWRTITRAQMPKARDDIVEAIAARKAEEEITADMTPEEKRRLDGGDRANDTQTKRTFALAPQVYPPPPPPKITTEEWQDTGGGEDERAEDADYWGAGEPRKPQVERRTEKRIRDDDQSQNEKKEKKKKKKKQRK